MLFSFKEIKLGKAHRLARSNYVPRIIGFIFSFLVILLLVFERGWSYWYFAFMIPYFLVYPHFVLLASKLAPDKKSIEIGAMMFDVFILGVWMANIHFFMWMAFAFLASTVLNHTMVGGYRQLLKALPLFIAGAVIGGFMTNFRLELEAPHYIEFMAMAALVIYIVGAAGIFYKQARRLAEIRVELEDKNQELNDTIQKLHHTQDELVEKAHKAGMAELATGILHNVGNVLNSVNISTDILRETVLNSKLEKFKSANKLLKEHEDNLEEFILNNPKGKSLLKYYLKLEESLDKEYNTLKEQTSRLVDKVQLIKEVIDSQQSYAKVGLINEEMRLEDIVNDTLKMQSGSIERHGLHIEKDFNDTESVSVQKSKVIHILINLFKNAKESMEEFPSEKKKITISTWQDTEKVFLSVSDTGEGIPDNEINKVFNHGFTTKEKGHGYGLHTCANYMTEMGGNISVVSEGKGEGATFILAFPKGIEDS
ncbi:hypothetical protein CK503_00395 [Aliifodinibius salipaludis]|uniref:histidine kinase n=1 Tax=Fodinibius salipaludis TaxID=2032627 RepID=A0A2A2GEC1_9BACT|nr:ATP-binding protein [Aliifodinibius salipaludis]PAU95560.1 hypothetical protein CK503_00395 [Aliifodinibius salipaludis]